MSLIAGEPTAEAHRAVNAIQPGPYAAVWLGVASWLFTPMLPLGLYAALQPARPSLVVGVAMFGFALAFARVIGFRKPITWMAVVGAIALQ